MGKSKQPDHRPAQDIIDRLGYRHGWGTLESDLAGYWEAYTKNPNETDGRYWAFTAMMMILAAGSEHSKQLPAHDSEWDLPPEDLIPVPWWVIRAIGTGWFKYLQSPSGKTMGEAFSLEGAGQGASPHRDIIETRTRDWKLALEVADLIGPKKRGITKAIADVADRAGLSTDTVKNAWAENKEMVRQALRYWGNNIAK